MINLRTFSHTHNASSVVEENTAKEGEDVAEIAQGILIGNEKSSLDPFLMQKHRITHVINCAANTCLSNVHPGIKYLDIHIEDEMDASIAQHLSKAIRFIKEAQEESGVSVLVHCEKGISRSASICIAYLIAIKGMNYREALNEILRVRPQVMPNQTFSKELRKFHLETKMQVALPPPFFFFYPRAISQLRLGELEHI